MSSEPSTLGSDVAKSLPKDVELRIRHLTHPPVPCDPIFSPPPGEQPEQTHVQSQFLAASIHHGDKTEENGDGDSSRELLVFGIEVLVYTTSRLTTVFVSKADSTGYLYLLKLPPGTPSLMRNLSTAFLSYLVHAHQCAGVRLVLSLFARSQNQYLFPGSAENAHKHILDDRGLVRWWCRVSDPILRSFVPEDLRQSKDAASFQDTGESAEDKNPNETENASATAYLIIPGCEKLETRAFFPPTFRTDDRLSPRWVNAYPLNQINSTPIAAPRCLIPRFPDDPKTRFLIDLDDEITPESETGRWRSVKTLEQFWEMMAFRQECSAGRLVGFLWMVVNPPGMANSDGIDAGVRGSSSHKKHAPTESQPSSTVNDGVAEKEPVSSTPVETFASQTSTQSDEGGQDSAVTPASPNEILPQQSPARGVDNKTIILSHSGYTTVTDFLGELDFADKDNAVAGTALWLDKLSSFSQNDTSAGETVVGQYQSLRAAPCSQVTSSSDTNVLDMALIRKRKRGNTIKSSPAGSAPEGLGGDVPEETTTGAKEEEAMATDSNHGAQEEASNIPAEQKDIATPNVLQPELVRKKKKT